MPEPAPVQTPLLVPHARQVGKLRPRSQGAHANTPPQLRVPLRYASPGACRSHQRPVLCREACLKGTESGGVWVPHSAQDTSGPPLTWEGHPGPDAIRSPMTGVCHHGP